MGSYGDALENGWKVGCVKSHFFDSGSYSLKQEAKKYAKEHNTDRWAYYDTDAFWVYVDRYAHFVQRYSAAIDYYANVDVIGNPELSYRNQKYLEEKHGLSPVPVVHYAPRRDVSWVKRYMDEGYTFIGIGGLAEDASQEECRDWIDAAFELVCDTPDRLPRVHLHGFGVTTHWMLWRWAWASVDSTAWTKGAAYGRILLPRPKGGGWNFEERPYVVFTSEESPHRHDEYNYLAMGPKMQKILRDWLDHIQVPLGESDSEGNIITPGVINRHTERRAAGLKFFEHVCRSLPKYPWPFGRKKTQSKLLIPDRFGIKQDCYIVHEKGLPPVVEGEDRMILFFSGDGFHYAQPEVLLGDNANVMLTFNDQKGKKPDPRFTEIYRVRKEALKKRLKRERSNAEDGRVCEGQPRAPAECP